MAKRKHKSSSIQNRRARFDYELGDNLIVGIELTGAEVKSLRLGHGQLQGAYVTIKDNELYLINAVISSSNNIVINSEDQTRSRKLLAKRREIDNLIATKQQGRTIVPLEILTKDRYIKLKIAIGKGKKKYDKRQSLKAKDERRDINRTLKHR